MKASSGWAVGARGKLAVTPVAGRWDLRAAVQRGMPARINGPTRCAQDALCPLILQHSHPLGLEGGQLSLSAKPQVALLLKLLPVSLGKVLRSSPQLAMRLPVQRVAKLCLGRERMRPAHILTSVKTEADKERSPL